MNRGSEIRKDWYDGIPAPSMRPRFMNRGSLSDNLPNGNGIVPFNEAPIHESGKCFLDSPMHWNVDCLQ